MQVDLKLPAFELDIRGWVAVPATEGPSEDPDSEPVVLCVSGAAMSDEADRASVLHGTFLLGLMDHDVPPALQIVDGGAAAELLDDEFDPTCARYLIPVPASALALIAVFESADSLGVVAREQIEKLMASFRWTTPAQAPRAHRSR